MRIAIFDDLPEGGAKRVAFEHVKRLSVDHTVYYISNTLATRFAFERYAQDVFRFDLNLWDFEGVWRPLTEASYVVGYRHRYHQIAELIHRLKVDVVLIHPSRLTQCPELPCLLSVPSVYFAEEWLRIVYEPEKHPLPQGFKGRYESLRRTWIKQLDWQAVQAATRVVSTSAYTASRMAWAYGRSVTPLSLGVDTTIFFPQRKSRKHFLFIGEKTALNGVDLLQTAQGLPIEYVGFTKQGFRFSDKQLVKIYSNAYATLCLARNEPFGLAALESMACETPVIAVAQGGYAETVIHGKTGTLLPFDPAVVEGTMHEYMKHPDRVERMGKASRTHVSRKYSWDSHILQLASVLHEVVL